MDIEFPVDPETGKPSSVFFGKTLISQALNAVNPTAAQEVLTDKKFRGGSYQKHIVKTLEEGCQSKDACMKIARNGIKYVYESMQCVRSDGSKVALKHAISEGPSHSLKTRSVKGVGQRRGTFKVPYKNSALQRESLRKQIKKWNDMGVIEPTAAESFNNFLERETEYLESMREHLFVVMGAGAAMGPFKILLDLGLNVVAVDLNRPQIWDKLIDYAQKSPGQMFFPEREDGTYGANLITEISSIAKWLAKLKPTCSMTIGNYAYVDGGLFVKIACAQDAISQYVYKNRHTPSSLAYLCSPTDAFLWPKLAVEAATNAFQNRGVLSKLSNSISFDRFCKPIVDQMPDPIDDNYIIECFVTQQGPNYAVAKRIQHWRALVAREDDGVAVSTNIAPSSSTTSVTSNSLLAAAYDGTEYFPPIEIFEPETSNHVMTAMMLNDICDKHSVAYPNGKQLKNPLYLFSEGSWHGGFWRTPFQLSSLVELSAVIGLTEKYLSYLALAVGLVFVGIRHSRRGASRL